ncbi:MAG: poly(A)-specific ribonuclease [Chaenotheca gracillima]|nr:MAG: poly(A)-specific ribonuclease [Chaenotheca gracillima]
MPSQDPSNRVKRPSLAPRSASSSSAITASKDQPQQRRETGNPVRSVSPNTTALAAASQQQRAPLNRTHSKPHVVGHARTHNRVPSHGKNMNRLSKLTPAPPSTDDAAGAAKSHRRSASHTPPTSPHTNLSGKRGGSTVSLSKDGTHVSSLSKNHGNSSSSKALLKKNRSDVLLKRNGLANAGEKGAKSSRKRSSSHGPPGKNGHRAAAVHFDLGDAEDDDDHDEGWTEVSNSPTLSRKASISTDAASESARQRYDEAVDMDVDERMSGDYPMRPQPSPPRSAPRDGQIKQGLARDKQNPQAARGDHDNADYHPDPLAITSRLLGRHQRQNAPPKTSAVSATATPRSHSPNRFLSRNQSLVANKNVPRGGGSAPSGVEVVSRFTGSQEAQASAAGSYSPRHAQQAKSTSSTPSAKAKAKATVQFPPSPTAPVHTSAIASGPRDRETPNGEKPSSRTQQKLWLQRAASSAAEPQNIVHPVSSSAHLPFRNASSLHGSTYAQKHRDKATMEYRVLRRYQNPVWESLARLGIAATRKEKKKGGLGHAATSSLHEGRTPFYANGGSAQSGGDKKKVGVSQSMRDLPSRNTGSKVVGGALFVNGTPHRSSISGRDFATDPQGPRASVSAVETGNHAPEPDDAQALLNHHPSIAAAATQAHQAAGNPNYVNAVQPQDDEMDGGPSSEGDSVRRTLSRLWDQESMVMAEE